MKAEPHVELQDGTVTQGLHAREVTGEEKARGGSGPSPPIADYADYQRKTERQIPVFVLEPR